MGGLGDLAHDASAVKNHSLEYILTAYALGCFFCLLCVFMSEKGNERVCPDFCPKLGANNYMFGGTFT
jgi:hypothetical protein